MKKEMIIAILKGKDIDEVALKYNYPRKDLEKLVYPFYLKEKLSKEQMKIIIVYGCYLKVPVEYLAEYVPCSRKICEDTIRNFNRKVQNNPKLAKAMSTTLGAILRNLSRIYCNSSSQNQ